MHPAVIRDEHNGGILCILCLWLGTFHVARFPAARAHFAQQRVRYTRGMIRPSLLSLMARFDKQVNKILSKRISRGTLRCWALQPLLFASGRGAPLSVLALLQSGGSN